MGFAKSFSHDLYNLDEKSGMLSRKIGISEVPMSAEEKNSESRSVLEAVIAYVQVNSFNFRR